MGLTMRQSTLSTADVCLKRIEYDLQGRPRTSSEASSLGTGYHYAMELYYRQRQEIGFYVPNPAEVEELASEAGVKMFLELPKDKWKYEDPDVKLEALRNMVRSYFVDERHWPEEYTVLGTEVFWRWEWLPNLPASGTIDLVVADRGGFVTLVDHKTAGRMWDQTKHSPRKNRQAPWYTYWWEQMTGVKPQFVFDIMTHALKFERRVSDVKPEHQAAVLKHAEIVAKMMLSGDEMPANPSSNLCSERYCGHWDVCPFGAILA